MIEGFERISYQDGKYFNRLGLDFYKGKRILLTGHTGFKGSWLSFILVNLGAHVIGYSLEPSTAPSLYEILGLNEEIESYIGDVRDYDNLSCVLRRAHADVVFHLAAQPLVLDGYKHPRYTFDTNIMGTVNILEAARHSDSVSSILNVTTDKVYANKEIENYGYKEEDPLDGFDPYSNSKSCSELVTHSYSKSFFSALGVPVSTARAGNVIGGGDFSSNRIIPDCVRAAVLGETLVVRNQNSTRPYQHVLEPLFAYLMIASRQTKDTSLASSYNVGPDDCDCVTTGELVGLFAEKWGEEFDWIAKENKDAPHESDFLKLDSSQLKRKFGWSPHWHVSDAVDAVVNWVRSYGETGTAETIMKEQITSYLAE